MTVHLVDNGVTLCGYVPLSGWGLDLANCRVPISRAGECSCEACAIVLQARTKSAR
jgi:hypothetical protein